MKRLAALLFLCLAPACLADITIGRYDMASVRDASTLETRVIEDWKPLVKDPTLRGKVVEITVCEWWPGQKVRLPVAMVAPVGKACTHVVIENMGLQPKVPALAGSKLRLLKEHGVGLVFIGMVPITDMEPVGKLHLLMEEHFMQTKDGRYTPAWIWGLSDMRALTAAIAEKDVFQPVKVLTTGGSKRGVGAAASCIADSRITAMMPVVAPIIDSPGGPYVEGTLDPKITRMNEEFLAQMTSEVGRKAMLVRQKARSDERLTLAGVKAAGWSDAEITAASSLAWEPCRTTNYLDALQKRGVEILYCQGSNDNVSPGLVELGEKFPQLPVYIMPGGQHGGAKEAGFNKPVASQPDVDENLYAFATHHFFGTRRLIAPPKLETKWDKASGRVSIRVTFPDGAEPQSNEVFWSTNRHPDYTMLMEFDAWQSAPLSRTGAATFEGEAPVQAGASTLDVITVHRHQEAGTTLTISSPELRLR
ncbi:MAG: hypothetical protein JNN17_17550 [Verrucomicrobiaceae bacterium]|nr:hypothetical protein [Verrucomicrobiaceae bacterium]